MTRTIFILVIVAIAFAAGLWLRPHFGHDHAASASSAAGKQLWTCSMHPQVLQDHPGTCPICHMELTPVKSGDSHDGGVTIDPVVVQNMGIRIAAVTEGPITQTVRLVGYLQEPEPTHRDINLRVSGWIEKLYANVDGMDIEKDQKLFDLYSPELMVAVDEMIAARKQTGSPTAQTLLESARRKLIQYGLTDAQIEQFASLDKAPSTIPILSPITGHLTAKMVYDGAAVKAGDLVMRLANRHQMWIDARVFEQQYPLVQVGATAHASVTALPGRTFEGKVIFVHPHVDPETRTALVRIEIPNHDLLLRQGMYATVEIESSDRQPLRLIPREAVIDTGSRQIAFVSLGDGKFEARPLKLGIGGAERIQVLDGVELGEQVVTSGQFLLDSESRLREAIAKQTGQQLAAASPAPARPAAEIAKVHVPHTDDIVAAYLEIQAKLGEKQKADTPADVAPLLKAASMAAEHAAGDAKPLAESVVKAGKQMEAQSIEKQRESFIGVSDAVIALAKASPPSKKVGPALFVVRCPMAFHDQGANWLQTNDTIANPYYATEMKSCGGIEETLPLSD